MNNARELLALRTYLATHMRPDDVASLAWPTVASLAGPGIGRGWSGSELAATALLGAYSDGVEKPAAYVVAAIRDLSTQDPPRERTATPPPVQDVLASIHRGHQASTHSTEHTATIRAQIAGRPA